MEGKYIGVTIQKCKIDIVLIRIRYTARGKMYGHFNETIVRVYMLPR